MSTWEVWRALKRLELLSAAPLTSLSCSPNFQRAQYLDIRTLTHELQNTRRGKESVQFSYVYLHVLLWA